MKKDVYLNIQVLIFKPGDLTLLLGLWCGPFYLLNVAKASFKIHFQENPGSSQQCRHPGLLPNREAISLQGASDHVIIIATIYKVSLLTSAIRISSILSSCRCTASLSLSSFLWASLSLSRSFWYSSFLLCSSCFSSSSSLCCFWTSSSCSGLLVALIDLLNCYKTWT